MPLQKVKEEVKKVKNSKFDDENYDPDLDSDQEIKRPKRKAHDINKNRKALGDVTNTTERSLTPVQKVALLAALKAKELKQKGSIANNGTKLVEFSRDSFDARSNNPQIQTELTFSALLALTSFGVTAPEPKRRKLNEKLTKSDILAAEIMAEAASEHAIVSILAENSSINCAAQALNSLDNAVIAPLAHSPAIYPIVTSFQQAHVPTKLKFVYTGQLPKLAELPKLPENTPTYEVQL